MRHKLDNTLFDDLIQQAKQSPRKRSHFNLHQSLEEPVQRLCIGLVKGTYVRPHYHPQANKWELLMCLQGTVGLVIFDREGQILDRYTLGPNETISATESEANTWHTVYPISDEAIIFEVKEGPYTPTEPSDFAAWSPPEGDTAVTDFLDWVETAKAGEHFSVTG